VVGLRFVGGRLPVGVCIERFVCERVCERVGGVFFLTAGFRPVVLDAPEETLDECLVRCLTVFFGAASAIDGSANAAMSANTSIFKVLRSIPTSSLESITGLQVR
jgi:hypothetical protein